MAGDHTVKGLLNERPDVARDELPFATKPSSGIYGDRTVNTYGTLDHVERGRTLESGTQEGAGDLDPGEVQETAISRPSVGTNPAWNGGAGAAPSGGTGGSGPGATQLARSTEDRQQDATSSSASESNEVEGAGSGSSSTARKATADGTTTTAASGTSGKGAKSKAGSGNKPKDAKDEPAEGTN